MYTLAGFDLTTHSFSLLGGRRRQYFYIEHAARAKIRGGSGLIFVGRIGLRLHTSGSGFCGLENALNNLRLGHTWVQALLNE
jgi:hypothetical protein